MVTFCVAVTLASGLDSTYLPPGPGQTSAPAEARSSTSKYQIIPIVKSVLENEGDGTYRYFNQTAQFFFLITHHIQLQLRISQWNPSRRKRRRPR